MIKFNNDGTVTIYDIHRQHWTKIPVNEIPKSALATLSASDRCSIRRHAREAYLARAR